MASDDEDEDGSDGYGDEDEDGEEESDSQSDIEDDMEVGGKKRAKKIEMDSESDSEMDRKGGDNVYKAPKLTAVTFEDKADKKKRMKAEFEKRKLGKSNLIDEL